MDLDINILRKEYLIDNKTIKEISKKYGISENRILILFKNNNIHKRKKLTKEVRDKISNTLKRKGIQPKQRYSGEVWNKGKKGIQIPWNKNKVGLQISNKKGKTYSEMYGEDKAKGYKILIKEKRKEQKFPLIDSSIEVKIQDFLKELNISFLTHQYMEIEHGYQCDILIPSMNLIIECDGDYWHKYPIGREIDKIRTNELVSKGFYVLRLWEHDIKVMTLEQLKDIILNIT